MELKSGVKLQGGKYTIVRTLGRGGFGVTYLAEQSGMQRKVCIKEFFPKDYYRRDGDTLRVVLEAESFAPMMERFKDKFLKEARTIALFKHPNIVTIYDVFEENDTAYYVMEYIEGRSLKNVVVERGTLSADDARRYVTQVASALEYVHSRNTVHLDVKPDNVMLSDEDGSAVLIDFGLSKHYDGAGEQTSTTPVGISRGYAPMEQYQTSGVTTFRPATDIYSLGATLFTLVTGAVPPEASVVNEEGLPTLPKSLSAGVRAAIERAMQSRTKDRPQTIAEFMQLLNGNNAGGVVPPKKPVVSKPTQKPTAPKKRSKWWLWLLLLLIVAGGAAAWFMSSPKDEPTPTPEPMAIVADSIEAVDSVEVVVPIVEPEQPVVEPEQPIVEPKPTPVPVPEPTPAPSPVLRLTSDSRVTVEHGGDNGTIRYTLENPASGANLSVTDDASWLTTSRSGNTISYSTSANESQSSRTATITVSYGDQSFEVAITQSGKPAPAPAPTPVPEPTPAQSQTTAPAQPTLATRGTANGHEWVDLGLPSGLKWATCNVGASNPGDYGNYYAWGEITPALNNDYSEANCSTWNQNIGDIAGTSRDAARQNWGGSWRMPRASEIDELSNNCIWTWTTQNGHNGYRVTGPNGNSIFLPAAGFRHGSSSGYVGSGGGFWGSTPHESNTRRAFNLRFDSSIRNGGWGSRRYGYSVRPVLE